MSDENKLDADNELEVTVGSSGIGAAMMQMNRAVSIDEGPESDQFDNEV